MENVSVKDRRQALLEKFRDQTLSLVKQNNVFKMAQTLIRPAQAQEFEQTVQQRIEKSPQKLKKL
ncbi:MAG: hypothetical protein HWD61_12405 [Parachlamydiaceae bacterium]|nr:MAG: hypothetical protein HWD61_12405 [Parachlamydiaceae bacterium]